MFDFLKWNRREQLQPIQFVPTVQIHPKSTLFIECTPNDPHTSSNIIINTYISKTNRTLLQTRIRWSRFKFMAESQHSIEQLPAITGNAYRCEPADLGSYIRAKITSFDVSCSGEGEVTIGPIRIDPTIKPLIEGALYSKQLRLQVKVLQKNIPREVDLVLNENVIRLSEINTCQQVKMNYDITEPRIELNPKDPTKLFLRFQNDSKNSVRMWLNQIYGEPNIKISDTESMRSQNSGSSKSKLFKGLHCPNKVELVFMSRQNRDQFLFSLRGFVCKENMRNTIVMQNIEHIQQMKNPGDVHKFFQFMSLKYEIFRLSELAKQFQNDRDKKIRDLSELEESIGEMTLTYTKIIEEKGKLSHIDFNQSYSEISLRREEILGRKQMREVMNENDQLKERVRQLNEELELAKFFKKQNNDSMMFNQTNNPFLKKNNMLGDSIYNPIMAQQADDDPNSSRFQKGNMLELAKSYMDVLKENQKLKKQTKSYQGGNISRDMVDILESLHDEDEEPQNTIKKQKIEIEQLKQQIRTLQAKNSELVEQAKKLKLPNRLNQSVAHQQLNHSSIMNRSNVQSQRENASFYSINTSHLNQSMTSEAGILMLQQKLTEIEQTNRKILGENDRLRKQRNHFRTLFENISQQNKKAESSVRNSRTYLSVNQERDHDLENSGVFDQVAFEKMREEKQLLGNENKSLRNRLESLSLEMKRAGEDSLLEKKCESLKIQNNMLRKQNEDLKKQITMIQEQLNKNRMNESGSQRSAETTKMKKINTQLLQQIKNLKIELQQKSDPLYNSRVIQLENEVNFYKQQTSDPKDFETSTKQLIDEVSKLQKTIEKLKSDSANKDSKLASQQNLIERLMSQQQEEKASLCGKDKSYSETRNDSNEVTEKLKKKIRQLQQQIVLMRRSADALNRSKDISMQMQEYNEQRMEMMQKERQALLEQNERLSRMCEKYAKDAREGIKWKKQYLDVVKSTKKQESGLDL